MSESARPTNEFIPFPREALERSIPDRFERIVRQHPDRLAVKSPRAAFTYAELDRAAERLARAILARSGKGERPVALVLPHDAPAIVAIFGALKSGKTYVPLDPAAAPSRLAAVLEDCKAELIITDGRYLATAKAIARPGQDLLDIETRSDNEGPGCASPLALSPDRLAYILYTSGSTGEPKGVVQTHRNLLHNVMQSTNSQRLCADDRLSLLPSYAFAASLPDIFGTLLNGALLLPFDLREHGLAALGPWLIRERITVLHTAPTIFRRFANALTGNEAFPDLRILYLSSEPLQGDDVAVFRKHLPRTCLLRNVLGITEISPVRQFFVDASTPIASGPVPVGYAVDGTEVLLVDEAGREVGCDAVGEILIRSRYLTPGYWRRPDLTQGAFLPDPTGGEVRRYRTGDLGRLSPDGCLVHLGRRDYRVKLGGRTADLNAIETALRDLPAVRDVVVVVCEDPAGEARLVAYLVPASQPAPTVASLRSALAERLPDQMVPTVFVFLDALPLTPNGKLDRRALPPPGTARPHLEAAFVAPRTQVEEQVAAIWAEVLGVDRVGIHDNFLELGGYSLLATQIVSRVLKIFRVEVPLRELLEAPTVAAMAARLVQRQAAAAGDAEVRRMLVELEALSEEEAHRELIPRSTPDPTAGGTS